MNVQQRIQRVIELNDHILETIEERDNICSQLTKRDADSIIKSMKKEMHDIQESIGVFDKTTH